jgi:predicted transcriptional regulator
MTEEAVKKISYAIRVLEQQAKLRDRLYGAEVSLGNEEAAQEYATQAEALRHTAAVLTDLLEE